MSEFQLKQISSNDELFAALSRLQDPSKVLDATDDVRVTWAWTA